MKKEYKIKIKTNEKTQKMNLMENKVEFIALILKNMKIAFSWAFSFSSFFSILFFFFFLSFS